MKKLIENILDLFYIPFRGKLQKQFFRYVACGGGNTALDILLFYVSYHYIFKEKVFHTPWFAISPHIASFFLSFLITFPMGFMLMRTFVFKESNLRGRVQLFRYFLLVLTCILLNYIFLKLFVDGLSFYPTPAKILTTAIVVWFSYFSQRYFTFGTNKDRK